ncbi:metal-dependent hydrolase family protein [Salinisphaera aquimarina]|uniref:Amidohydrolase family protein n=1 Tax=Salinisphaera aquimarina TaxID=2094031 RepID=A0ABV7EM09_9GAMM
MLIIDNCHIFDGLNDGLRADSQVVVEDGRIKDIGAAGDKTAGAEVIDARGRTLMPGLIDAHVHAYAATANLALVDTMAPSYLSQFARASLESMLQRGFTSVRDAAGADYGLGLATEQGYIRGPRLFYSGKALSQTGGHGDSRGLESGGCVCGCGSSRVVLSHVVDGVTEIRKAAREELRRGATQIKIMASGGVSSPSDPIWNLQFSEEEIRAAVWEAHAWGRYVLAHAYTPEAIRRCLEYGVRSIEHANLIDADTAAFAAAQQAFVVPTLVTYEALETYGRAQGFPAVSLDKLKVVRDAGVTSLEHLKSAGVRMGFGTDLLGEMQVHQLREFSIRAEVLSPFEILQSATSINAEILQQTGELGVIQPRARADMLLVDGNPLEDLSILERPAECLKLVMKGGEIYKNESAGR